MKMLPVACALLIGSQLMAQVGTTPQLSPFRDLDKKMELSLLAGVFNAGKDPVGVAPQTGPYVGARYDYSLGSLVSLSARLAVAPTTRNVINPAFTAAARFIGETNETVLLVDGGFTFNLTGARSFHNLVPVISVGAGLASGMGARDAGGYALTPGFQLNLGGGVKWLVGESMQFRLDLTDYLVRISYPSSYFEFASDGTTARSGDGSVYTSNLVLSVGVSHRFFR